MSKTNTSRTTLKLKQTVAVDPAARARRAMQQRLSKARISLEAFAFRLEQLHLDKTGCARDYYSREVPILSHEARKKMMGIARTEEDAEAGCALCAAWLEETADLRQKIADLRSKPLPRKDPSYTGWPLLPSAVDAIGRVQVKRYHYLQDQPRPSVPELLAEREANRLERKARGAAFLQDFINDVADSAEVQAAANVPH